MVLLRWCQIILVQWYLQIWKSFEKLNKFEKRVSEKDKKLYRYDQITADHIIWNLLAHKIKNFVGVVVRGGGINAVMGELDGECQFVSVNPENIWRKDSKVAFGLGTRFATPAKNPNVHQTKLLFWNGNQDHVIWK